MNRVQELSVARNDFSQKLADREEISGLAQAKYHSLLKEDEGAAISKLPDAILAIIFEQVHKSRCRGSRVEEISNVVNAGEIWHYACPDRGS